MTRAPGVVSVHTACRRLKVHSDYLRGLLDGLGIEPAKVRHLPVLSPEQFEQVQARVEGIRAVRARRSLGGRCRTRREGGGSSWGFAGGGSHGGAIDLWS
jgi:hypothetical protein